MSPARPRLERVFVLLARATARFGLLASLLACAACDTDFSPGWQEQLDELMDAGARPEPPPPGDAGQPDSAMPQPDAAVPPMQLFECMRTYRCDPPDPSCPPLCLVLSMSIDRCTPGEECRSGGYTPVRCEYCMPVPIR